MKRKTRLKAFVLSLAMALGMLLPATMFAQRNDNLLQFDDNDVGRNGFATNWALYNSSFGSGGYNLNNQTFGQDPAPLGSGLLILTAIGAGYAAVRRKR
ncbi:MAG: hypothetical protein CW336_04805 [Bacteroidetes bacterium]|nr:hypothetical protein [Bacteroidota bacterium]